MLIDQFLEAATEIDVDAICDGEGRRHRRHHAAHRRGRHSLRRFLLRAARGGHPPRTLLNTDARIHLPLAAR